MKLDGKITISRITSNVNEDKIQLDIIDTTSSKVVVRVSMSVEDFGYVISGLSRQPCEIRCDDLKYIGKKRETKTVVIPKHEIIYNDATKTVEKYCVDGWEPRIQDVTNPHNSSPSGQRVLFERWV